MNRIEKRMQACRERKEKAFITYITAGLPNIAATKEIIKAQERGGCDVIEVGIPFSDPVADGPVIQDASYRALCGGVNLKKIFAMMEELRMEGVDAPILFMMYYNTILHYGVEAFVKRCSKAGVDGLLIPDLPFEEQAELKKYLDRSEQTLLIQLVSPASGGRIGKILEDARGFVYCASPVENIGQSASIDKTIKPYIEKVRNETELPLMMESGICTPEDVEPIKGLIDGVVVGSHFITLLDKNEFCPQVAEEYCQTFRLAMNG